MPQLDTLTFLSQLIYTLLFFFLVLLVVAYYIIPSIYKQLRIRNLIIEEINKDINRVSSQEEKSTEAYEKSILTNLAVFNTHLLESISKNAEINSLYSNEICNNRKIVTEKVDEYKYNHPLFLLREKC